MIQKGVLSGVGKQAREDLRQRMLARGCTVEQIAEEMIRQWRYRPRHAWRYAHGLSQDEVARRYNDLVRDTHRKVSSKRISDYEAWPSRGLRPTLAVLSILAKIYETAPRRLVDLADTGALPAEDLVFLATLEPAVAPTVPQVETGSDPSSFVSRIVANSPYGQGGVDVMAAAHESSEHAANAESTNIGPTRLEHMRDEASRLSHALMHEDPVQVFRQVTRLRDQVYRTLEGRQYPAQTSELYLLAAVCCCLLSDASHLLGYRSAALEQTRAAWAYAEIIGHNSLRVWCRSMQSWLSFTDERPQQAVALARSGQQWATNPISKLRLKLMEGTALAAMGDSRGALDAFTVADSERERVDSRDDVFDDIGGSFSAPPAKQYSNAAAGYILLGMADHAQANASRAIELYVSGPARDRDETIEAGARITMATARLIAGDLEAAREELGPVLALPAHLRVDSLTTKLRELRMVLRSDRYHTASTALELGSDIEEFGATLLPGGLPESRR